MALLAIRRDQAEAFGVQAVANADGTWVFDALGIHLPVRSTTNLNGSEFRRIVEQTPEIAVLRDTRDSAILRTEGDHRPNLISVTPDASTSTGECERFEAMRKEAPWLAAAPKRKGTFPPVRLEHTPGIKSVQQLEEMFSIGAARMIKSLVVVCVSDSGEAKPIICAVRGDHDLDLNKVVALTGSSSARLATASEVRELTGAPVGFAGPIPTDEIVDVVFDAACPFDASVICGRHLKDYHLVGALIGRDLPAPAFVFDIAHPGLRPTPTAQYRVFWLRQYFEQLVSELLVGTIRSIDRPFGVVILPARPGDIVAVEDLAERLAVLSSTVHIDDRPGSFGRRIADWELLVPAVTIVVGRKHEDGLVEVAFDSTERIDMKVDDLLEKLGVVDLAD